LRKEKQQAQRVLRFKRETATARKSSLTSLGNRSSDSLSSKKNVRFLDEETNFTQEKERLKYS
jgi:hypothetical protein